MVEESGREEGRCSQQIVEPSRIVGSSLPRLYFYWSDKLIRRWTVTCCDLPVSGSAVGLSCTPSTSHHETHTHPYIRHQLSVPFGQMYDTPKTFLNILEGSKH